MKILLLGGTGAMGIHLVNLLEKRAETRIFITTRKRRLDRERVKYIQGDAHDLNFLMPLLDKESFDAVVDFMIYETAEFNKRIDRILERCVQYIFLSSARVFANEDEWITERSPRLLDVSKDKVYLKTDEYALRKAREENILRQSVRKNWTIVRPYITFSEARLQLGVYEKEAWLYQALHGRSIVFSQDIANHYTTMTYALDVARGIAGLIDNPKAMGEDFNITTTEAYTWQEILDLYLMVLERELGMRPNVKYTDTAINLRFKSSRYQVKYCRLFDRRFDNRKILSVVPGLRFSHTLDCLKECVEAFLRNPFFRPGDWGARALFCKVSKENIPMSEFTNSREYSKYLVLRYAPWWTIEVLKNRS